jgi:hypothetical protein
MPNRQGAIIKLARFRNPLHFSPMKHAILLTVIVLWVGCGGADEKPVEAAEPPTSPSQSTPKAEPVEATLTPGMEAAKQALDAGNYAEAIRLYTAELAAEQAKPTPSWVQLSFLYNALGFTLDKAAQYAKALENYQKALAIQLKQLGAGHPSVA